MRIIDNPKDNILCITYTNRAADELSKDVLSKNVFIGTIHSFLHSFLKPYFAHQNILELYFEIYGARISERIDNKGQKDSITESNARYIEKYGKLDYDTVRKNIKVLSYNESPFSSLYYANLLTSGELNAYLADIDRQAEELFLRLVKQMADAEGITETLKANDQMEWVGRMNSCRDRASETVYHQVIYT